MGGLDPGSLKKHDLTPHAVTIEQASNITHGLELLAPQLENTSYLNTCFPNQHSSPSVPACTNEARYSAKSAEDIFAMMKKKLVKGSS